MKATLYTDGGARGNPGPAGIGYVLTLADGRVVPQGAYIGETTNNQAEYTALVHGLERALKEGVRTLDCFLDSELVVKQIRGEYRIKDENLKVLAERARSLVDQFEHVSFNHVRREKNQRADALVNEALDRQQKNSKV